MVSQDGQKQITICVPTALCDLFENCRRSEMARHVRGAHREMLLALRSVIDAHIESLGEDEAKNAQRDPSRTEAKRVDVK